ncbi:MAG TPA: S1 RNA-binding domain-containing protein [Firmicutes bacterium]|nr:S1 RNA-binding domain-containing protein [Bacillota bacterium]
MNTYYPEGWLLDSEENNSAMKSEQSLQECIAKNQILEARATLCDSSHNLHVNLGCMKGIIPREEGAVGIKEGTVRDIALIARVNKPVCFTVQSIQKDDDGSDYAILSRRQAQELCSSEYISNLLPGDIINARVTHLEPFGAFCDIGCGIISLIPIDMISVSRISHPRDRFAPGYDIKAVVKSVDADGRISLSHKELLGTWEENAAVFEQGQTVSGIIRSVEDYGVFVELTPNLAGLAEPHENVYAGQQASVYIKSLIPEKMKVKLIIVDSFDADYSPAELKYFLTEGHIDRWVYSPESCEKVTETIFE